MTLSPLILAAALSATAAKTGQMSPTSDVSQNRVKPRGATHSRSNADLWTDRGINVKTFGAAGDGVTDDTAAIRAALAAVPNTGGSIYLPASTGCYIVSGGLRPKAGTTVNGQGYGSCIQMRAGGWDSYVEDAEYGDNMGVISILRSHVRLHGIRIVGSLTANVLIGGQPEYRYNPQLVFIGGLAPNLVTDTQIDGCFFESNLYNGLWPAGTHEYTTHISVTNSYFTNIGRYTETGNPYRVCLQMNDRHWSVVGNHFERCGNAISATGSYQVVKGNVIKDSWQGILIGDAPSQVGVEVTGNVISAAIDPGSDWTMATTISGIYANQGSPAGHDYQIADNIITFVLSTTQVNRVVGIQTDGVDVNIKNNQVIFDVESAWSTGTTNTAVGISVQANGNTGTVAHVEGNHVTARSRNGWVFDSNRATGIQVYPQSGNTLTAYLAGNRVRGFEAGGAVAVSAVPGSGTLTIYVDGDVISGGYTLYGSNSVATYNVPIRLALNSAGTAIKPYQTPLNPDRVVYQPSMVTTIAVDSSTTDHVIVRPETSAAWAFDKPTNATIGKLLTFTISNQSGGALGTVTWVSGTGGYNLSTTWSQPAAGYQRSVLFYFDGASWYEIARGGSGAGVTIGATANGLSLTGEALELAAAGASQAGAVTTGAQTWAGRKTFSGGVAADYLYDSGGTTRAVFPASDHSVSYAPSAKWHWFKLNGGSVTAAQIGDASNNPIFTLTGIAYASLPSSANGTIVYCSDCTIANPCAGSGTGAFAKRLNGAWVCN